MFSSIGLFKEVRCPEQPQCNLPNCIFKHQSFVNSAAESSKRSSSPSPPEKDGDYFRSDPPSKRRRLDNISQDIHPHDRSTTASSLKLPLSASRAVSPSSRDRHKGNRLAETPPSEAVKQGTTSTFKSNGNLASSSKSAELSLNPRMLQKPPTPHALRMQFITMLHERMHYLNEEVKKSEHPSKATVHLTPQALIAQALSEEEKLAVDSRAVYTNVIKLRIVKLKKMRVVDWIEERLKQLAKVLPAEASAETKSTPKIIETGLTSNEEIAFLPRLFADQRKLARSGYVIAPIGEAEMNEARRGVEAAQGWEQCDRCRTRFQVFPGRREEDGFLTSGGQCLHHPGKPRRPTAQDKQDKADRASRELFYTCCNEAVSVSAGCATAVTHVFKISEAKRLALVMPFELTPPKSTSTDPKTAVCFDCEMGYTTLGLELIRLTATSWPSGESLIDVLVRPLGEILDLNSRFSGVWPKDFANAPPYDPSSSSPSKATPALMRMDKPSSGAHPRTLQMVASPAAARTLLFAHLHPSTPLIGHALDNDLNAVRIIHPSIVDTVLLYPHPKGLPIRFGLKALMKKHLDRDIQMGGPDGPGHDSGEDARAAGELVRLEVAETWGRMRRIGWTIRDGEFLPPSKGR